MLRVIDTTGDVVYLEIAGVHSDWTTYKFEIDIDTPGKKVSIVGQKKDSHK